MTKKPSIPTRTQILDRIKQGPTQFAEWAYSKNSRHPARLAARAICDELVAEGLVRLIYIGEYRYYIMNTLEAERQAMLQFIEERSKPDSATGCTAWTGYQDPERGPVMRISLFGKKTGMVRRVIWEMSTGEKLGVNEHIKMKPMCDEGCVDREHMLKVSRSVVNSVPKTIPFKIKQSLAMQKRYGTKPEDIELIRSSDASITELARITGYSRANVQCIKEYKTLRFVPNTMGLGAL